MYMYMNLCYSIIKYLFHNNTLFDKLYYILIIRADIPKSPSCQHINYVYFRLYTIFELILTLVTLCNMHIHIATYKYVENNIISRDNK